MVNNNNNYTSNNNNNELIILVIITFIIIITIPPQVLKKLDSFAKSKLPFHPEAPLAEWVVRLFADQDDWLVESMVCGLDIYTGLGLRLR